MRAAAALALLALYGCSARPEATEPAAAPPGLPAIVSRTLLAHPGAVGLSGLGLTEDGTLLAVPERQALVLDIDVERGVAGAHPVRGVPEGLDVEGVASVGRDLFLATEGVGERQSDAVLWARRGDDGGYDVDTTLPVVVRRKRGSEPLVLDDNAGLEGICVAGAAAFVAVETVAQRDGRRAAPLVSLALPLTGAEEAQKTSYFVALTSDTGKLSGIDCVADDDGVELVAIERHFGVSRLLRFAIAEDTRGLVEPELVADLVPLLTRGENFEGVAILGDGRVALVNDNDYGEITGPSELVIVDVPALRDD